MKKGLLHIVFLLCVPCALAQEQKNTSLPDSTAHTLQSVEIIYRPEPTYKTVRMDSILLKVYKGRTLADLLQGSGVAYLRQYAPGQIASISLRGSNADQVQLIWNGFNLNNLSLGQTDFSLVPVSLFSGVTVNMGALGATGGNGVVAGSVLLRSNDHPKEGQLWAEAGFQAGSFGKRSVNATFLHRSKKVSFGIKPFYSSSQNNYTFINAEGKKDTVEHAQTRMMALLATGGFFLRRSDITASAWLQGSYREIPATVYESRSYATQDDRSFRISVNQHGRWRGFFRDNRIGYFYDQLNYLNTLFGAAGSGFRVHNIQAETESGWDTKRGIHGIKLFVSGANAFNTAYEGPKNLFRSSVGYFFDGSYHNRWHWNYSVALKEEVNNGIFSVPVAQLGLSGWRSFKGKKYTSRFNGRLNTGTVYRFPTLNDLYWNPGGNPHLKPEKGVSANLTTEWKLFANDPVRGEVLKIEFTHYQRYMYDWIMWQPRGVYWTPQNLQEVWSRGNETSVTVQFGRKFKVYAKTLFNYTLSTVQKSLIGNDQSIGRQLIYTPMYSANAEAGFLFKGFSLSGTGAYYGYRYTSSDNYEYLDPFYLLGARVTWTHGFKNVLADVFVSAENLLNENYYWVAQRPALPRNYSAGFSLKWIKTKKQSTQLK